MNDLFRGEYRKFECASCTFLTDCILPDCMGFLVRFGKTMDQHCAYCQYLNQCSTFIVPKAIFNKRELLLGVAAGVQRIPVKIKSSTATREIRSLDVEQDEIGGAFLLKRDIKRKSRQRQKIHLEEIDFEQISRDIMELWELFNYPLPPQPTVSIDFDDAEIESTYLKRYHVISSQ